MPVRGGPACGGGRMAVSAQQGCKKHGAERGADMERFCSAVPYEGDMALSAAYRRYLDMLLHGDISLFLRISVYQGACG